MSKKIVLTLPDGDILRFPKRRLGLLRFIEPKVLGKTKNVKNLFSKDI